jgi:energy-coupling factor transport system ATP-binding protein
MTSMNSERNTVEARGAEYVYEPRSGTGPGAQALNGISLNIVKGEFVSLIGGNGSGKSTFARLLNALLLPTGGAVCIKGIDTRNKELVPEIRKWTGMVFQDPDNQIIGATVEEDVAFGPENLGMQPEAIRGRIREALRAVGMEEYADNAPHLLSGGEKQKVSLAGILAMKPECIILDEATALLDPVGRKEIMELVVKLNREEEITVLHITHNMEEAALADRVIVIDAGGIVLDGKPGEVFSKISRLKELGLDVPQVTELFHLLRLDGYDLTGGIPDADEAAEALIRLDCRRGRDVHPH